MKLKGSYTVEMALLSPLILGTVIFVIYTSFYFYNAGIMQITAYTVGMEAEKYADNTQKQLEKILEASSQKNIQKKLLGMEGVTAMISIGSGECITTYKGSMSLPFFKGSFFEDVMTWNISVTGKSRIHKEKEWIQEVRRLMKLGEKWMGED